MSDATDGKVVSGRVLGLDAVRGFALLGITLVNMGYFASSSMEGMKLAPAAGSAWYDILAFYFVSTLCAAKFFPLYSLLFGVGLAIMHQRAVAAGRDWLGMVIRRLAALAIFGLLHAVLIWNGDILFIYAGFGLLLVPLLGASARTLTVLGSVALLVGVLGSTLWFTLNHVDELFGAPVYADHDTPLPAELAAMSPLQRYWGAWSFEQGVYSYAAMHSAELEAYGRGPWSQALGVRVSGWSFGLIAAVLAYGWLVLAQFMFGAALLKAGYFGAQGRAVRGRAARWCFGLGVPMALAAALLPALVGGLVGVALGAGLMTLAGPMLALGWVSVFVSAGERVGPGGALAWVFAALARVGKFGLTNYLLMSVLATGIMYHWGLGLIGSFGPLARCAISVGLFAVIVLLSWAWARRFEFGPMEWLWRGVTHLRRPGAKLAPGE